MSSPSVTLDSMSSQFKAMLTAADAKLKTTMSTMTSSPTQAELIDLQKGFQEWSLLISIITTTYKEIGDTLKGIMQKV